MLRRLFLDHPHAVGESYVEHMSTATRFGTSLLTAGLACLVHALVPVLFTRTGSATVKRLYGEMKRRQPALADQPPAYMDSAWQLDYEI